jgi:hypothetical protein
MPSFANGFTYPFDAMFGFSPKQKKPFFSVDMTPFYIGRRGTVSGKMDTGTERTILTFETAHILGIKYPEKECIGKHGTCYTASGEPVEYYSHPVSIYLRNRRGQSLQFRLCPGFAEKVKRDLFGMDWTNYFCLGFDFCSIHLLCP